MEHNRNDGHKTILQIPIQPNIGLDGDARHSLIEILNHALADEAVLAAKTRGAHWNVSGTGFFEMQILFKTQYEQLNEIADKIAERTRILGGIAFSSFKEFLTHSRLEENSANVPDMLHLLADHELIIRILREDIRKVSEEFEDEVTVDLIVGVMNSHEKIAWILRSYIENEPVNGGSQIRKQADE